MEESLEEKMDKLVLKNRPSIEETMMKSAFLWSKRSTCLKYQVGCVIAKNKHTLCHAYNGVVSKAQHCCDYWKENWNPEWKDIQNSDFRLQHHKWSEENEIHAEMNAILQCCQHGLETKGAQIYVTMAPCINCAKMIFQAGINKVYYLNLIKGKDQGIKFLEKNNIICIQIFLE